MATMDNPSSTARDSVAGALAKAGSCAEPPRGEVAESKVMETSDWLGRAITAPRESVGRPTRCSAGPVRSPPFFCPRA